MCRTHPNTTTTLTSRPTPRSQATFAFRTKNLAFILRHGTKPRDCGGINEDGSTRYQRGGYFGVAFVVWKRVLATTLIMCDNDITIKQITSTLATRVLHHDNDGCRRDALTGHSSIHQANHWVLSLDVVDGHRHD